MARYQGIAREGAEAELQTCRTHGEASTKMSMVDQHIAEVPADTSWSGAMRSDFRDGAK
jgi:hypothetical protein